MDATMLPERYSLDMRSLVLVSLLCIASAPAFAAERCTARTIRDVGAEEAPDSVMHRGTLFGPITQMRVNKKNGRAVYCEHGGYCYNAGSLDIISPCRISSSDYNDDDDFYLDAQ